MLNPSCSRCLLVDNNGSITELFIDHIEICGSTAPDEVLKISMECEVNPFAKESDYGHMKLPLWIDRVIFAPPATIIYWNTGDKTVVKCKPGDVYDKEKGFSMCLAKKFLGNEYKKTFKEYIPKEVKQNGKRDHD